MDYKEGKAAIECLLFVAGEPLTLEQIGQALNRPELEVVGLLKALREDYLNSERGLQIIEVAGGYQLSTRPEYAPYLARLAANQKTKSSLSQAALETLAVIAYKQPVTRVEIEAIRGVRVDKLITTLTELELIEEVGRKETVGRPILYGTTKRFLQYFGLNSLEDLPPLVTNEFSEQNIKNG